MVDSLSVSGGEPDWEKIIVWVLMAAASGTLEARWVEEGKELSIRMLENPSFAEWAGMEGVELWEEELFWKFLPVDEGDALRRVRTGRDKEAVTDLFVEILGPAEGKRVAEQMAGEPYERVLEEAFKKSVHIEDLSAARMVRERESLTDNSLSAWEGLAVHKEPKRVRRAVLAHYSKELSRVLPKALDRAEKLRLIPTHGNEPEILRLYLAEAGKCYVYSRYLSCALMCRAALEIALRDYLKGRDVGRTGKAPVSSTHGGHDETLGPLITRAQGLQIWRLGPMLDDARVVLRTCNKVAHPNVLDHGVTQEECYEVYLRSRGVIKELYAEPKTIEG